MSSLLIPNIDVFEERSAIAQHEEGLTRKQAEDLAAQAQGFRRRGKAGVGLRPNASQPPRTGGGLCSSIFVRQFGKVWQS
tara:strand:- start:743 stop:982 length:240 start_codon:yes stop_codon:yes gene_type:complete